VTTPKPSGLLQATLNSLRGFSILLREKSAQREMVLLTAFGILHFYFPSLYLEAIIVLLGILLALESLNTAIEKLSDLVEPNFSLYIREVKDLGSTSILIILFFIILILIKFLGSIKPGIYLTHPVF